MAECGWDMAECGWDKVGSGSATLVGNGKKPISRYYPFNRENISRLFLRNDTAFDFKDRVPRACKSYIQNRVSNRMGKWCPTWNRSALAFSPSSLDWFSLVSASSSLSCTWHNPFNRPIPQKEMHLYSASLSFSSDLFRQIWPWQDLHTALNIC